MEKTYPGRRLDQRAGVRRSEPLVASFSDAVALGLFLAGALVVVRLGLFALGVALAVVGGAS